MSVYKIQVYQIQVYKDFSLQNFSLDFGLQDFRLHIFSLQNVSLQRFQFTHFWKKILVYKLYWAKILSTKSSVYKSHKANAELFEICMNMIFF